MWCPRQGARDGGTMRLPSPGAGDRGVGSLTPSVLVDGHSSGASGCPPASSLGRRHGRSEHAGGAALERRTALWKTAAVSSWPARAAGGTSDSVNRSAQAPDVARKKRDRENGASVWKLPGGGSGYHTVTHLSDDRAWFLQSPHGSHRTRLQTSQAATPDVGRYFRSIVLHASPIDDGLSRPCTPKSASPGNRLARQSRRQCRGDRGTTRVLVLIVG